VLTEFRVVLAHDCLLATLTRENPALRMQEWCNRAVEVIQATGPEDVREDVVRRLKEEGSTFYFTENTGSRLDLLRKCRCMEYHSLLYRLESLGCMPLYPVTYEKGEESFRFLTFEPGQAENFLKELADEGHYRLLGKRLRETNEVPRLLVTTTEDLFDGLSDVQADLLRFAFERGYYDSPRRVTTEALAKAKGLARSTLEEHLRKGESRLVGNAAPLLEAWRQPPEKEAKAKSAKSKAPKRGGARDA